MLDSPSGHEEADEDALPEREEQNSLDAKEFGCRQLQPST